MKTKKAPATGAPSKLLKCDTNCTKPPELSPPKCQSCGTRIAESVNNCTQCEAWFAIYQLHQAIKEIRLRGRL